MALFFVPKDATPAGRPKWPLHDDGRLARAPITDVAAYARKQIRKVTTTWEGRAKRMEANLKKMKSKTLPIGTACSGVDGVVEAIYHVFAAAIVEFGLTCEVKDVPKRCAVKDQKDDADAKLAGKNNLPSWGHKFSCECDLGAHLVIQSARSPKHLFADLKRMGTIAAPCVCHAQ